MTASRRIAFSHDWLNGMRGGEKCLELLCRAYPDAPIYTLLYEKGKVSQTIAKHPIITSWIDKLPGVYRRYRNLLPLFPAAIESFGAPDCDVLISFNHCVSKGIKTKKKTKHICYCFTPMRYAWGFFDEYFGNQAGPSQLLIKAFLSRLREWDLASSRRVDVFVAISEHIRKRIKKCYDRESEMIYPPANTLFYTPDYRVEREDYYLVVSALVPYKRVDLAVEACKKMKKKLVVIGTGPALSALQKKAGPDTAFLGWQSDDAIREHYRKAKALLFPGEEDFGIVPVEMQACGGRVIALERGGALETVIHGETGLFFKDPTPAALADAMSRFENRTWDEESPRKNAARFSNERFIMEMKSLIQRV